MSKIQCTLKDIIWEVSFPNLKLLELDFFIRPIDRELIHRSDRKIEKFKSINTIRNQLEIWGSGAACSIGWKCLEWMNDRSMIWTTQLILFAIQPLCTWSVRTNPLSVFWERNERIKEDSTFEKKTWKYRLISFFWTMSRRLTVC